MTFKEVQELVKLINKSNLTEFKLKDGDFELTVRTNKYEKNKPQAPVAAPQQPAVIPVPSVQPAYIPPAAPAPSPAPAAKPEPSEDAPAPATEESKEYKEIRSPIVGTFYRSQSPEKPPYIKVGDKVESSTVVCIVEAMKLFNEIESEVAGKIVNVMVEDASPVEYDQVLFMVDPKG